MKKYTIKKLIKGYKIKPSLKDKTLVAIPHTKPTHVIYGDESMDITEHTPLLHSQTFDDKFRHNRQYTLYYYEWEQKTETHQTSLF